MILNSAGEGIFGVDSRGNTTFVNATAAKLVGRSATDLLGISAHAAFCHVGSHGRQTAENDCPILEAMRAGEVQRGDEKSFGRADGPCFPVQWVSTPTLDGETIVGAVVVFSDITEPSTDGRRRGCASCRR